MNNYCRKCGTAITSDFVFCTECGTEVPPAATELTYIARQSAKVDPRWATFYAGFGIASMVLGVFTPILFAGFGYFLGSATKGYSLDGGVISFVIGVIGGAMIFGSGMILMAFGQMLKLDLTGHSPINSVKYKYAGITFLFISSVPFVGCAAACLWLVWQTPIDLDEMLSLIGSLLLFIGFIPCAVLYASGRTLMACEHLLNLRLNGPFSVDPARYRGLGIAALIFGGSTPVITIVFSVVAAIISPLGLILGFFLLTLGYGVIPGAMLIVAGMILLGCEQMFSQILNGTPAGETVKYRVVAFAAIVLGVIVPITAVVKGFAAILGTIGAGGLIPALPPLYLGFIGCPVLMIGGVTLLALERLLKNDKAPYINQNNISASRS